ncbi:DinB family protein [Motilibacter peucedani]|uniref:DinB family protein n=1 Tax=Motilibacter peucedani TaxID=598650 RepID=A0A420XPW7_9ACTN|nr:DinB family protein [Motilibacter peucedani]RKS75309.1 DinB family protein [Motilibacter peucedani]
MDDLVRAELLSLFDHAWQRFTTRLDGLTDDELVWTPTRDARISLAWRLEHIGQVLTESRNWTWLGAAPPRAVRRSFGTASDARAALDAAYAGWRALLSSVDDLGAAVGPAAGAYAHSTRLSFVLHVADELVHHCAEAAMLRDLYAG